MLGHAIILHKAIWLEAPFSRTCQGMQKGSHSSWVTLGAPDHGRPRAAKTGATRGGASHWTLSEISGGSRSIDLTGLGDREPPTWTSQTWELYRAIFIHHGKRTRGLMGFYWKIHENPTRGMANVKAFFKELSRTVAFVERGGDPRVLQTSLNLRLTGNPGMLGKPLVRHGQLMVNISHFLGHVHVHVPEVQALVRPRSAWNPWIWHAYQAYQEHVWVKLFETLRTDFGPWPNLEGTIHFWATQLNFDPHIFQIFQTFPELDGLEHLRFLFIYVGIYCTLVLQTPVSCWCSQQKIMNFSHFPKDGQDHGGTTHWAVSLCAWRLAPRHLRGAQRLGIERWGPWLVLIRELVIIPEQLEFMVVNTSDHRKLLTTIQLTTRMDGRNNNSLDSSW